MTSWIGAIANTHPQHWAIAKQQGCRDMTKTAEIAASVRRPILAHET